MFNIKAEAKKLVSQMTLEEKVSQMLHTAPAIERLNIPSYNWWNEALHGVARAGVATMFPQAIGLAATFDPELIYEVATVISDEGRAKYNAYQEEGDHDIFKGLTFWSPNINIFRDPRWGRGHETYGEDPYLTARLGVSFIKGLQGDDRDALKTAACAKHFAVHSGPEGLRHEFNAIANDYDLWNTYLPAFEACVTEAGVEIVMGAYNRTNGEPCCGSKTLLLDILRDKWAFDGHVVSDCWAIKDFHEHHKITSTPVESVAMAVRNGCDLNCGNLFGYCVTAVQEGLLTEAEIDRAVTNLMVTRMRLGLLGAPENKAFASIPYDIVDCEKHRGFNQEVTRRSLVMLKNDGVLPLKTEGMKTIAVVGPNADSRIALEGNYQGVASDHVTVLQGVKALAKENGIRTLFAEGCPLHKVNDSVLSQFPGDRQAEALIVTRRADAVVIVLGLDRDLEGEEGDAGNQFASGDKLGLALPGRQQIMAEAVIKAAKENNIPVVVVVLAGSALDLRWADENANAVIQGFYPGSQGGLAIAELLFGKFSPVGRLPLTFYRSDEDLPEFTDYSMENRTYRYFKGEALYPFGFGLGFEPFELSNASYADGAVTVTVKNAGKARAAEIVQVYIEIEGEKENRSLCGLKRVELNAGESAEAVISVPSAAFMRYDEEGDLRLCYGKKALHIGFCQPDARSVKLKGSKPVRLEVQG
ncbi:MAG: glycoside hydrolase family 3 C-terminal domain-containing protein [Oscillospiraceae bacterium]|jgi:beta-glucosidase|nr:glycoside hydrolase family 3 C-terminal domain-containing protein [Oscillospiraceae bacterium]